MTKPLSNIPKKESRKISRSPTTTMFSGHFIKNNVVIEKDIKGKPVFILREGIQGNRGLTIRQPLWDRASKKQKVMAYMHAVSSLYSFTTVAFTVNFSPSTEKAIRLRKSLDYPRDMISKALTKTYGAASKFFFFVAEVSKNGRLHIHGAMTVPTTDSLIDDISSLFKEIENRLSKKYKQAYNNKRTHHTLTWAPHINPQLIDEDFGAVSNDQSISLGWGSYTSKNLGELVRSGVLNNDVAVSSDLTKLARFVWTQMRIKAKQ